MMEGSLHILHERVGLHHAGDLDDGGQHGGVGEVLAQFLLGDLAGVDGADPALVALQQGTKLGGGLAGVDDDGAFFFQTGSDVHSGEQGFVHHHHVVGEVDVGVDGTPVGTDPVVRRDGGAHALGAVFREALDILARIKGGVRQQQGCRLGTLPAASVLADFYDIFHKRLLLL